MSPLDRKLFRDLWHVRGQALAIALVMACGVSIVIMSFGAKKTLEETRDAYYEQYNFADVFSQLKRAPLRVAQTITKIPGVAQVETGITHYAALDIDGSDRPAAAYLVSLPERGETRLNRIAMQEGRLPMAGRDELVMSVNMARALGYSPGSTLAVILGSQKRTFTVSGIALSPEFVYVQAPGQLMPDDRAFGILWIDHRLLEAAYDMKGAFNDVSIKLGPGASHADVITRLDAILSPFGGAAAYGRVDQTSHAYVDQELGQLGTIAAVLPPIFLAVAAFLIHIVLSRLIDTEREAIGLLKSFGYSSWEVGSHYLKFSFLIATAGVVLGLISGLALGIWMTGLYQQYFRFPFLNYQVDAAVFSAAILSSFVAAGLGTWSAVFRAVRLSPAAAMLPPAPPVYRQMLIDRLGLTRHISAPTQMILRHISRWPLRAIVTSFGVATAVMLLVSLFFFFDAIDELVDKFYFQSNRYDVVIGLVDQRNERARFEAARLPGVRRVEPVLEVPARLSHGHLNQRIGIVGLDQGSSFRAFYDSSGRAFTIPENGIVLSDKLAALLRLRLGDRASVQVLEGNRRFANISVSAIANEPVGLAAYMDRRALGRLSGQSGSISALQAVVDAAAEAGLFRRLKDIPSVATVSTRAQAILSLRETMAQSMVIVIDFYVVLGAIIAFGVVYNAARISLAERGRDLASLRVLGFTKGEVAYILLGELALLVFAALPVGCFLGYGLAAFMSSAMDTKLFRVPFVVTPATFGTGMSIALVAAGFSAMAVAWRISRLDLIAVLKTRE